MTTERVIFRKWRDSGDIVALFPDISAGAYPCGDVTLPLCQSYEHVGQHGGADYRHVLGCTIPASPAEYADLAGELSGRGYRLKVYTQPKRGRQ